MSFGKDQDIIFEELINFLHLPPEGVKEEEALYEICRFSKSTTLHRAGEHTNYNFFDFISQFWKKVNYERRKLKIEDIPRKYDKAFYKNYRKIKKKIKYKINLERLEIIKEEKIKEKIANLEREKNRIIAELKRKGLKPERKNYILPKKYEGWKYSGSRIKALKKRISYVKAFKKKI